MHPDAAPLRRSRSPIASPNLIEPLIEPLERRALLAAAVTGAFDIANTPVYKPISADLADVKRGPMANAGSRLIGLYLDYRRAVKAGRAFVAPTSDQTAVDIQGDKVGVTLRVRGYNDKFLRGLKTAYSFDVTAVNEQYSVVQGYLPINWLREISSRKDVAQIWPMMRARTATKGSANNQGDQTLNADQARANFNVDGTGVKVGVISDSVNRVGGGINDSRGTGDLPQSIQVLADTSGTDEGRAMLEQIYDIAPGASLAFSTGEGGQQAMANSIKSLGTAGAGVIVDDLGYPDEPFFQEGVIDGAIRQVVSAGATYLQAVGNSGTSGFEQQLQFFTQNGKTLHDFDPGFGPGARDTRMRMTINGTGPLVFGWDNPYNGITGTVTSDLDIRLYQAGTDTVKYSGLDDNILTGQPLETMFVAPGVYDVEITREQLSAGATNPTRFKFAGEVEIGTVEFDGNRSSGQGHAVSNAGISIAAVPWFNAPPVSPLTPIRTEDFSSQGGGTYVFDANGNRQIRPTVTQKPDFAGVDGVNTSFFGSDIPQDADNLPNFFGTSSAAPNVAAVVALIKQASPTATQDQIIAGLKATARPLNGTAKGVWDSSGGFGLVDANASVPAFASPPSATVTPVSPDPRGTAVSSITVKFNQQVSGVTVSDFSLTRDGSGNLLTSKQGVSTSDNITYTVTGLSDLTVINGTYTLTLTSAGSGITNVIGQPLSGNASDSWLKIPPPPVPNKVTTFNAVALSSTAIQLNWVDNNNTENEYTVLRSTDPDFVGRRVFHLPLDSESFVDSNLAPGKRYYYRVRGVNTTGPGPYSTSRSAATTQNGEVVIDNDSSSARAFGFWAAATSGSGFSGVDYLQDGDSAKGTKEVRYTPNLAATGDYFIYARWARTSKNATNVPFDVFYGPNRTLRQTILIDQRNRGGDGGWILIGGPFRLEKGSGAYVRIRNGGTNGTVVADALRFLPAAPLGNTRAFSHVAPAPGPAPVTPMKPNDEKGGSLIDGLL